MPGFWPSHVRSSDGVWIDVLEFFHGELVSATGTLAHILPSVVALPVILYALATEHMAAWCCHDIIL